MDLATFYYNLAHIIHENGGKVPLDLQRLVVTDKVETRSTTPSPKPSTKELRDMSKAQRRQFIKDIVKRKLHG